MDSDEADFVFFGTPIEREEELASRKKKAVAEASGHLRTLAPWKQEVRDEEGRRRFHGAFTGGFSAGYYNTVGSKEGWTPQSFTSSRKNRAEVKQQSILNFLDEDEKAELEGQSLGTSAQFDTFGFTAAEFARKQAEKEQQERPSAIPGPVPNELVLPVTESIGVKLLLKMGWRRGRSIKDSNANSLYDARREARKALFAFSSDDVKSHCTESGTGEDGFESFDQPFKDDTQTSHATPVFVRNPKQDLHGLGYDPYKHAPEFREKKRSRLSDARQSGNRKPSSFRDGLFGFKSGKAAPGFGIGALEEYGDEDEDVYATAYDFEETSVQEVEEPLTSSVDHKPRLAWKEHGVLPGFRAASNSEYQLERFDPPVIPKDFVPRHTFPSPLKKEDKHAIPPPPEVPPPEDANLKLLIDGVASLAARCGKSYEDLLREKIPSNPQFSFLDGGNGHEYYTWKLWEESQKHRDHKTLALDGKSVTSEQKLTAESRGKILGERPLDKSLKETGSTAVSADFSAQFNLSDTFTNSVTSGGLPELAKPFKDDPAKQARFELFLKEKYRGGLRSTDSIGASNMSEAARARERLDFEAAAEAIDKGKWNKDNKLSIQQFMDFSSSGAMQFTSGGLEGSSHAEGLDKKGTYPKREEFQWRPHPVLCKRFDLIDPFTGKPLPPPRMKSKMDSLVFNSDSVKATLFEGSIPSNRDQVIAPAEELSEHTANSEKEVAVEPENVERPVDLYKAIFSDDSDDEVEIKPSNKTEDPEKKVEVAHSTLNRLIAGDFLESLGKELGLAVPPDLVKKTETTVSKKPGITDDGNANTFAFENIKAENAKGSEIQKDESVIDNNRSDRTHSEKRSRVDNKSKSSRTHHRERSSSSSEDERSSKRRSRHRYSSSDSYSDPSDDDRRSKGRRKESSRDKRSSSSKKHSKHHKHRSREKERSKSKREKRFLQD